MTRRRKTKREREDEWYEAQRCAWEEFRPKLAASSVLCRGSATGIRGAATRFPRIADKSGSRFLL